MPDDSSTRTGYLRRRCWGGAFAVLCAVLQFWPGASESLRFERLAFTQGALWQPLTSQWVHLNLPHAVVNAMAAVLLCWLLMPLVPLRRQLLTLLGGFLGVALVLVLDAHCAYYAGASGALHGVLAGAALHGLMRPGPLRYAGAGLTLLLAAKLYWEMAGVHPAPGWLGIPVYYPAHAAGAAGGVLVLLGGMLVARLYPAAQRPGRQA